GARLAQQFIRPPGRALPKAPPKLYAAATRSRPPSGGGRSRPPSRGQSMRRRIAARRAAMTLARREFLQRAAGAAATLPALVREASAQNYPSRPVRLILGFPAGGSTDLVARIMAAWLTERLRPSLIRANTHGGG